MNKRIVLKVLGLLFLLPNIAIAHTGAGETTSLVHGLIHPIGGLDHLLAMIAVGIWAAQLGGRALWVVPSAFVTAMIVGGSVGFLGLALPFVETGIAASVLVLGLLVAGAFKLPTLFSAFIVGLFALFHGYAHAAEMAITMSTVFYSVGFVMATAMLHAVGITLDIGLRKVHFDIFNRFIGGTIALSGLYLMFA